MTRHTLTRLFSKTASPGSWVRDGGTKPTIGSDGPRASVMLGAYGSCVAGALQMRLVSLGLDFGLLSKQSHFGLDAEAPALSDERLPSPPGDHHRG